MTRNVLAILGVAKCMRIAGQCLFLLALLAGLGSPMAAQTGQGSITGRVTDANGAVVRNAKVQVANDETGVAITTVTNSDGVYNVESLNPGEYTVTVTSKGFDTEVVHQVTVGAAQQPAINVVLKVGQESTELTVNAEAALLSTSTSDVTTTVDHQIVQDLPYPDRSSLEAVLLVPGVTGDPSVSGGVFSENPVITTGAVVPGASITVGGAAPGTTAILVDGSDITQPSYARAGVNLSGRIVQETTVITGGLSAKYGRTGGGVIVQVTKAGTNQYHGAITWRHTDPYFNAFPLGSVAANATHENYYGFYLGGPVRIPKVYDGRDKTFFYVGVEPARIKNSQSFRGSFDTPDDLAGRLHNSLALISGPDLKVNGYAHALTQPRTGGIFDQTGYTATHPGAFPFGTYKATPTSQSQITGPTGIDDVSVQLANNPLAQVVNSYLPTPSNPGPYIIFDDANGTYQNDGTNAQYARGVQDVDNRYSIRLDHQLSNANEIWARYTVTPITGTRFFALSLGNPLNQVPTDKILTHNVALGYTHIFSSSIVNEFHYSFMRVNEQRLPYAAALNQDWAAKYGVTPATVGKGFPALGTLGTSTLQAGSETPYGQIDQNFIAGDNLTWTKGNHLIQFGVDIRWIQSNQYDTSALYGGKYSFGAGQTAGTSTGAPGDTAAGTSLVGDAMGTFILGTISNYSAAPVSVPGYYRWKYFAGYVQDDWRVSSRLTLNLGLRYDIATPRAEKFNNQAFLQLNSPNTLNGIATSASFCFSGACGTGRTMWPINWYGIQPRIGIAYAPTPRTTIRAAYGILRLPLTGYENLPDPNFNVASAAVMSGTTSQGGTTANYMVNYMSNPVAPLTSSYTALAGNRGPILSSNGLAPVYVDQRNVVPYTQNYSMTLQYQPTSRMLIQVTYQGLKGTHLIGSSPASSTSPFTGSLNAPSVNQLVNAVQNQVYLSANAYAGGGNPYNITNNGAAVNETMLQKLGPSQYQNFFNQPLTEIYPREGASQYNAFYAQVAQRYSNGLSLLAYYSWSKSLDDVPDANLGNSGGFGAAPQQNPLNTAGEWSVSTFDQPSRLKLGYVYDLPIGRGHLLSLHHNWLDQLIGNISTSGIATIASGFPNFVVLGDTGYFTSFTPKGSAGGSGTTCNTTNYCASSALPAGYTLRPNIVPGVPLINKNWKPSAFTSSFTPYLNPAAFGCDTTLGTCTPPGSLNNPALGNAPRTLAGARSPREFMFDARVSKGFKIKGEYQFKLFANFNNAFNHPVYFIANATASGALTTAVTTTVNGTTPTLKAPFAAATFGKLNPNTANLSRVIRVGAEFTF